MRFRARRRHGGARPTLDVITATPLLRTDSHSRPLRRLLAVMLNSRPPWIALSLWAFANSASTGEPVQCGNRRTRYPEEEQQRQPEVVARPMRGSSVPEMCAAGGLVRDRKTISDNPNSFFG